MDFGISEEQELLQQTVRGYVNNECPVTTLRKIYDSESCYDSKLRDGLIEMGIAGLITPEEYGGVAMEVLDMALVAEVMGEGALPLPFLGHSMATLAILEGGSEEQKQKWLPELASGELLGSVAFAEPTSATGEAWEPATSTLAVKAGKLSGCKTFVPHANFANLVVVTTKGGGLAVVDLKGSGIKIEPIDALDRTRPLGKLHFENCPVEELPNGIAAATRVRDLGLILLAADAFGSASRLTQMTVEYTKTRKQFNTPIAQFQAVKHQVADMAIDLEPTRALWWYAAHAFDHLRDKSEHAAALAKAHVTERSMEVARSAFELHGGIGYTWECDLQFWFKRCMFDRVFLGTPAHHLDRCAQLAGW